MLDDPNFNSAGSINILNVGTKILVKDVMDNCLRVYGNCKTFYASNMAAALRAFSENTIHIVFCEVDLEDGSAYRLIQSIGGVQTGVEDLYLILAMESKTPEYLALAEEIGVHSMISKPFSPADLKEQLDKYLAWKAMPKEPWILLLGEADMAIRDRRYRDAEVNYQEAIAAAPTNPEPLFRAATYYLKKQDYPIAEPLLKKSLEINPNYVRSIGALGTIALMKHDLVKSKLYFDLAQKISPHNPDRVVEFVKLYLDMAMEAAKAALRIDTNNTQCRMLLGKILAVKKDYISALREFERVLPILREEQRGDVQTYMALSRKLGNIAK